MLRTLHRIILGMSITIYIILSIIKSYITTVDLSKAADISYIAMMILVGIWVVDFIYCLADYVIGTAKDIAKEEGRKSDIISLIRYIFN